MEIVSFIEWLDKNHKVHLVEDIYDWDLGDQIFREVSNQDLHKFVEDYLSEGSED